MKRRDLLLAGLVAASALCESAAVILPFARARAGWLLLALALHLAAAGFGRAAARRRFRDLSQVENDILWVCALGIPLFGAPFAFTIPIRRPRAKESAPTMFDRYEEHVRPHIPEHERSLFTGDYEKDLARELDCESYFEVLRHGQTDQKRNALRRLADLGAPRHLEMVRRCLVDPDHEVRLYAYSELERLARTHEERIARLRAAAEGGDAQAIRSLAEAHFLYGESGIQDREMAAYHFRLAARHAGSARAAGDADPAAFLVEILARIRLEEYEAARELLARMPAEVRAATPGRSAAAELCYRQRDFKGARAEAEALATTGANLPGWMAALVAPPGEEEQR